MKQEDIESLPLFPDYITENIEDNTYIFKSAIYIHKDSEEILKVYLYPVIRCYIAKTELQKKLVIRAHLRECFRLAKYFNVDTFDTTPLPLVTSLDKRDEEFLHKLHFNYT